MRFRNITRVPVYIPGIGDILPLRTSVDITELKDVLKKILKNRSLDIILDDEELKLVKELLSRTDKAKKTDVSKVEISLGKDTAREYRKSLEEAKHIVNTNKIKEAQKQIEFFADRKPEATGHKIDPKKVEGTPKSLADIMNHNAALQ